MRLTYPPTVVHDCITRFVPNPADTPAIERLIEQHTPVALKTRGTAELEGLQLPAWKLVLITDREFFGQHSLAATGYVRRRRKAAARPDARWHQPRAAARRQRRRRGSYGGFRVQLGGRAGRLAHGA